MTDLEKINTFQDQTAAAFTRIVQKGRISFGDAAPIEESMTRLEIGGSLSITELLRLSRLLSNTCLLYTSVNGENVTSLVTYQKALLDTMAGETVTLRGKRLGAGGYVDVEFTVTVGSKEG